MLSTPLLSKGGAPYLLRTWLPLRPLLSWERLLLPWWQAWLPWIYTGFCTTWQRWRSGDPGPMWPALVTCYGCCRTLYFPTTASYFKNDAIFGLSGKSCVAAPPSDGGGRRLHYRLEAPPPLRGGSAILSSPMVIIQADVAMYLAWLTWKCREFCATWP